MSRVRGTACALAVMLLAVGCTGAARPQTGSEIAAEPSPDASTAPSSAEAASASTPTPGRPGAVTATARPATASAPPPGAPLPSTGPVKHTGENLFTAAENSIGITNSSITVCAHAALTYAAAFNTSADDLNVYWEELNRRGGVFGRKVNITYENDNYSGPDAIAAAERCKQKKPALIIGGIGFDQIPSVRDWAEKNRQLYVHHTATVEGTAGKKYSFTGLPTVEKAGEMFAELALSEVQGQEDRPDRTRQPQLDARREGASTRSQPDG